MSVHQSASINSAPTGWIFTNFYIEDLYKTVPRKFKVFFGYSIIKINRQQFNKVRKFPIATLQSKYKAQYMQHKSST